MEEEERGAQSEGEVPEDGAQNGGAPNGHMPEREMCESGKNGELCPESEPQNGGKEGRMRRNFALWRKPMPCQGKRYSKSFQIALAGISCALAVAALVIGYYSQFIIASMFVVAEVALMIPLSKQFIAVDLLAYLATVILGLFVSGFLGQPWLFVPFIMFFGLHPVVNCLQLKYSVNRWLALIVKIIWFDAMLFVWFYALGRVMGLDDNEFIQRIYPYLWIIILVGGSLLLWVYDYIMFKVQIWINRLVYKIKK